MSQSSAVRKAIEDRYGELSAQQRRVADFLLANQRTAFSLSVHELASSADVSEATVVRFAREVGFSGYMELRTALTDEAKADLSPERRFAAETRAEDASATLQKVAALELQNIHATMESIDSREFDRFVGKLRRAEHIATMGVGVSALLARMTAYLFSQIGARSEALVRDTMTLVERVELLPKKSALLAFSFPPYSRETIRACERARERKIPVLAVTDAVRSPIREIATVALYVRADNLLFTNSVSSALLVINAVVTDVALADKKQALACVQALNDVAKGEYL